MTTLAADTPRVQGMGDIGECPMVASDIIYAGAAVGKVAASGHARPLTSADEFLGFADDHRYDNSSGAAAAMGVRYWKRGAVQLSVSGAVITDVKQPVYATDDNTFVFSPVGGVFIGFVARYVSSGVVIVEFDALGYNDPYKGLTCELVSDDKTLDAQDSGKAFFVDTDAKTVTLPAVEGMAGIRVVNIGAFGTVAVTVSPNANDMVEGPDITGADNKDLVNTKATARRGDYIDFEYSDANGWVVTKMVGTWAREA